MTFLLTCGVLCLAIVGIVCDVSARRAWWLGFALFGLGYLLLAFWSSVELPTMAVLDAVGERLGLSVHFSGGMGGGMRKLPVFGEPPSSAVSEVLAGQVVSRLSR